MSQTRIRGNTQIKVQSIDLQKLVLDFLGGSDWNITNGIQNATLVGLKDAVAPTSPITKQQFDSALAGFSGGLTYKGTFDASNLGAQLDNADQGDFYIVATAGVILGTVELAIGDHIIINKDVVGTPVAADIDKIDNSESLDLLRSTDIVDNLTSTDSTKVLSAAQGKVLQDQIDVLQAAQTTKVFGELPIVTSGSAVLGALAQPPISGTLRVYLNGLRLVEGSGNDYTTNYSSGVITMDAGPLSTTDVVVCDYEF